MALTKAQLVDMNANELILDLDADTSITSDTDDQIDIKIGGADDFRFTANTFTGLAGSTITSPTIVGSTSVQTPLIEFTDGDDAMTIADGGVVTFAQAPVFPDGSLAVIDLDIDGATDIGAAIVDADLFIIDDGAGGANRKTAASRLKTYIGSNTGGFAITNLDIDGGTDIGAAIVDADLFIVDDGAGGANRKTAASRITTYVSNLTLTTAAQANVTSLGTLTTLTIDNVIINGSTIGHTSDTDLITVADGIVTVAGEVSMTTLDIGGTNVTSTATELNQLDGVVAKTAGKETIWIPAQAMTPTSSNGCAALATVETTSGRPDMNVLDFDKDSDEFAQFAVAFPKSYNLGTVTFQFFWSGIAATTGVNLTLAGVAMNDNQTIDVAYGTAVAVADDAQGAVEELLVSAESGAVTIAGTMADNDLAYFRIGRDVSADNMAGDCRLHGIKLHFTTDAANDA